MHLHASGYTRIKTSSVQLINTAGCGEHFFCSQQRQQCLFILQVQRVMASLSPKKSSRHTLVRSPASSAHFANTDLSLACTDACVTGERSPACLLALRRMSLFCLVSGSAPQLNGLQVALVPKRTVDSMPRKVCGMRAAFTQHTIQTVGCQVHNSSALTACLPAHSGQTCVIICTGECECTLCLYNVRLLSAQTC